LAVRDLARIIAGCAGDGYVSRVSKPSSPVSLPIVLIPHPHVRIDPSILGGSPHISGSRVPVRRIFAFYRDGARVETILRRFPQLGAAKVFDALAFALDNPEVIDADDARERDLLDRAGQKSSGNISAGRQIALPFDTGGRRGDQP
jgi:uncharacterized protein (DUF433 family)